MELYIFKIRAAFLLLSYAVFFDHTVCQKEINNYIILNVYDKNYISP